MRFCLKNTGKCVGMFSHMVEIEASQLDIICESILKYPLGTPNLHFPCKDGMVGDGKKRFAGIA